MSCLKTHLGCGVVKPGQEWQQPAGTFMCSNLPKNGISTGPKGAVSSGFSHLDVCESVSIVLLDVSKVKCLISEVLEYFIRQP